MSRHDYDAIDELDFVYDGGDLHGWPDGGDLELPLRTAYEPRGGGGVSQTMTQMINQPAPCDDCVQKDQCKAFSLACHDYKLYVSIGVNRRRRRAPTRKLYMKIYSEVDDE